MTELDRNISLMNVEETIHGFVKEGEREGYKKAESVQARHIADLVLFAGQEGKEAKEVVRGE